eukprot:4497059-Amphidinium_carterae.1
MTTKLLTIRIRPIIKVLSVAAMLWLQRKSKHSSRLLPSLTKAIHKTTGPLKRRTQLARSIRPKGRCA